MAAPTLSAPRALRLTALLVAAAGVARADSAAQEAPARSLKGFRGGGGTSYARSYSSSSGGGGGSHDGSSGIVAAVVLGCLVLVVPPLAGCIACHAGACVRADAEASDAQPKDTPPVAQQVTLVTLDRSDGAALGVDISKKQDHLLITRIHLEGLASEWNKAHPDAKLQVDDKIVAVNGAFGSSDDLLAQCKRHAALRISVVPAGAVLPPESLGWQDACVGIGITGFEA